MPATAHHDDQPVDSKSAAKMWIRRLRGALVFIGNVIAGEHGVPECLRRLRGVLFAISVMAATAFPFVLGTHWLLSRNKGDSDAAEELAKQADSKKQVRELYACAAWSEGNHHADRGEYKEARSYYRLALLFEPDSFELNLNYGRASVLVGDEPEAAAAFGKALALKPEARDQVDMHIRSARAELAALQLFMKKQ
jgi:tetratricopeptide (TPR) repeat protein